MEFICICCHREVAAVSDDGHTTYNDCTTWTSTGAYGSRVLDGEVTLRLFVCDTCLLLNHKFVHTYEPPKYDEALKKRADAVIGTWDPTYDYTSQEHLRVYRMQDGGFCVKGRLEADEEHASDPNVLGYADTLEGALRSTFQHHANMIFNRDNWRRERPATFKPVDPAKWAPRHNEETRAIYVVGEPGPDALGGGSMILRMEREIDDGCYEVRVRPADPDSQFDDRLVPKARFKFGFGKDHWLGYGVVQEPKEEDEW